MTQNLDGLQNSRVVIKKSVHLLKWKKSLHFSVVNYLN